VATFALAFGELLQRLELNPTRRLLAAQRYNAVRDVVAAQLVGAEIRRIGSFQRNTKIRPINLSDDLDVDALVVLADAHGFASAGRGMTSQQALAAVVRALRSSDRYRVMEPKSDAPTVVLEYADSFRLELAVGYRDFTGKRPRPGGPACYLVAAPGGGWQPADYDYDASIITSLNQDPAVDGALVPTIKILKHLVRSRQVPLGSFHVEILSALLVPPAARDWRRRQLRWGIEHAVAHTLAEAGGLLRTPVMLPGSYSPAVDSGLGANDREAVGNFLYQLGTAGWKACAAGAERGGIAQWRSVVGDPFPSVSSMP
jgi:hypothetical protein